MSHGFWLSPTSSQPRMGILQTKSHKGPNGGPKGGPKTTRDAPEVAASCFVRLLMHVYNPHINISLCRAFFCSLLPHLSLGWGYRTPLAIRMSTILPCIVGPKAMRSRISCGRMGMFYRNPGAELLSEDCPLPQELAQRTHVLQKKANSETRFKAQSFLT